MQRLDTLLNWFVAFLIASFFLRLAAFGIRAADLDPPTWIGWPLVLLLTIAIHKVIDERGEPTTDPSQASGRPTP